MSLFRDMYPTRVIFEGRDLHELERMLDQAIQRGYALEIPVSRKLRAGEIPWRPRERWFVDTESEEIYSLIYPDERGGTWDAVLNDEIAQGSSQIQ
jgi:hypothetical protein